MVISAVPSKVGTSISVPSAAWAKLIGTAANLAYHLSGSIAGNLHKTSFLIEKDQISLQLTGNMQDAIGDAIKRRMDGVREAYKEHMGKERI